MLYRNGRRFTVKRQRSVPRGAKHMQLMESDTQLHRSFPRSHRQSFGWLHIPMEAEVPISNLEVKTIRIVVDLYCS